MYSSVSTIWVLLGAAMVFLMQAGFAMCEAGFTRAKNTGNILMKNLMDFCIGTPTYWILGFGLMFAGSGAIVGGLDPFVRGDYSSILPAGVPLFAYLIFQTVFCATSATIVSGSMAERTKFISYCLYSFCISAFIYPISGHWIWGGGWLSQMGFHDFAGSTAVHMCLHWRGHSRAPDRQVRAGRQAPGDSGTQPVSGRAGRVYPLVLLVRLQRLLYRGHGGR